MAIYGFRTRNEDGSVDITISTRITRNFGRFDISVNQNTGSFTIPIPAQNYFFYIDSGGETGYAEYRPELQLSGNVISWNFKNIPIQYRRACGISYGGW